MTERQRKLLLLIEKCQKDGIQATIDRLSNLNSSYVSVRSDLFDMKELGMIYLNTMPLFGTLVLTATLTNKAMQLMPRVRELV